MLILAGVIIAGAAAQENPEGRIFYAHGTEFTLIIGGQQETYGPGVLNFSEVSLGNEDIIRTGRDSFAEIQVLPDGTGIKVAENTSIRFSWNDDRVPVITILYGRIRVVTGFYARHPALIVQAGNGISGVQNGDFCFDYAISPPDPRNEEEFLRPKLQLYDFRGSSNIALTGNNGMESVPVVIPENLPVIPVNEREWVSVEVNSSLAVIERRSMDMGMIGYWNQNNFRGTPPIAMPDTVLAFEETVPAVSPPAVQETSRRRSVAPPVDFTESQRRLTQIKNALIISGLSLTVAGIVSQATGYGVLNRDDPARARTYANFGFIPIGIGISALITSLFFNPAFP
jgi:hypothetical protein